MQMNSQKKLLFVVNPHAGKAAIKAHLLPIVDNFVAAGYWVNIHTSQRSGDITEYVKAYGEDCDIVVCSGGDGTVNEAINGIMSCARKPVLGYIPAGTTNDFASGFRLPKNMVEASKVVVSGVPTYFDVGRFGQRYFAYVAAFGAFTDVTYQTSQDYKNIFGKLAYVMEGAARLPTLGFNRVRMEYDDGVIEDDILVGIVTNSSYVAGLPIGRMVDSTMNDGLMEVFLIKNPSNILEVAPIINSFLQGEVDRRHIHMVRTKKLRILTDKHISWALDGEYGGYHKDARIENLYCALRLMVPAEAIQGD